jgi:hypothetical protein
VFERLEARAMTTLGFNAAVGLNAAFPDEDRVAIDSAGDIYITGDFTGAANFDPGMGPAGMRQSRSGVADAFVAKYSPDLSLQWVRQFATLSGPAGGAGSGSRGTDIAVDDATGSVIVVGQFLGTVDFDSGGTPLVLTSVAGAGDSFIIALTAGGVVSPNLVKQFGGAGGQSEFTRVTVSPDGRDVGVTGSVTGTLNFDPGGTSPGSTLTTATPTTESAFALELTNRLGFVWVQQPDPTFTEGFGIAFDDSGALAIAGAIAATEDAFAARFDGFGNVTARRAFLGTHPTTMAAVATGLVSDGTSFYVAGTFRGLSVNVNATTGTAAVILDSRGDTDAFLIKLDPRLNVTWARRFGSPGADSGSALAIDGGGNLYLGGSVSGLASFGTNGLGTVVFSPGNGLSGTPDVYVLEVDAAGNVVQPIGPDGNGTSTVTGIAANRAGGVAIAGFYSPTTLFGAIYPQAPGTHVPFVATLAPVSSSGGGGGGGGAGSGGPTPTGVSAPVLLRALRLGRGRRPKIVTGFRLTFSAPLDAAVAASVSHYRVIQPGRTRPAVGRVIPVLAAQVDAGGSTVTLILGKQGRGKPLTLTATGLVGAQGTPVATIVTRGA